MTKKLRQVQFSEKFTLPGEQNIKQMVMHKDIQKSNGKTCVYCAPVDDKGRIEASRGYYIDWETEVTILD